MSSFKRQRYDFSGDDERLSDAGFPIEEEYYDDEEETVADDAAIEQHHDICVNLEERTIAIKGIMSVYSQISKSHGAQSDFGSRNLVNRYGVEKANLILKDMNYNNKLALKSLDAYFDTLIAARSLEKVGFDDEFIQSERTSMRSKMWHEYGPDNAGSYNRKELIKKVQAPQDKRVNKKSTR